MKIKSTMIPDVKLILPSVHADHRGTFQESWQQERYAQLGLPSVFTQDNVVTSRKDVLRGLHLQMPRQQGKLVQVLQGEILDVAVDVRCGSPTFGRGIRVHLSDTEPGQLWVPPGLAHGYYVLSDKAIVSYKCTASYAPGQELTIRWDDPDLAIPWPTSTPIVSAKDAAGRFLRDIPIERLPPYLHPQSQIKDGS